MKTKQKMFCVFIHTGTEILFPAGVFFIWAEFFVSLVQSFSSCSPGCAAIAAELWRRYGGGTAQPRTEHLRVRYGAFTTQLRHSHGTVTSGLRCSYGAVTPHLRRCYGTITAQFAALVLAGVAGGALCARECAWVCGGVVACLRVLCSWGVG